MRRTVPARPIKSAQPVFYQSQIWVPDMGPKYTPQIYASVLLAPWFGQPCKNALEAGESLGNIFLRHCAGNINAATRTD